MPLGKARVLIYNIEIERLENSCFHIGQVRGICVLWTQICFLGGFLILLSYLSIFFLNLS